MSQGNAFMQSIRPFKSQSTEKLQHKRKPRHQVQYGDAAYVEDGGARRFGIWTGDAFVQYAHDPSGVRRVHEVHLHGFLRGASRLYVCRFPQKYGRPDEIQIPLCGIVMPTDTYLLHLLERKYKQASYHLYSPEQTVRRAKSCLGKDNFASSEDFAVWCKTGVTEWKQLHILRQTLERIITY